MWYNYLVGPMARPGARRLGPGLGLKYSNCVAGRAWTYFLRTGPGPHNSVCGPGPGRVCTTVAGPGRAWASNHICGPGLGQNVRPVQGPSPHHRNCLVLTIFSELAVSPTILNYWSHFRICQMSCDENSVLSISDVKVHDPDPYNGVDSTIMANTFLKLYPPLRWSGSF